MLNHHLSGEPTERRSVISHSCFLGFPIFCISRLNNQWTAPSALKTIPGRLSHSLSAVRLARSTTAVAAGMTAGMTGGMASGAFSMSICVCFVPGLARVTIGNAYCVLRMSCGFCSDCVVWNMMGRRRRCQLYAVS